MFRMEFQPLNAVEEEDDGGSRVCGSDGRPGKAVWRESSRVCEGQVGRMQRSASSNAALTDRSRRPLALTRIASSGASTGAAAETSPGVDPEVLRELVRPFAESVTLAHPPVFVSFLEYQADSFRNESARSSSMRSTSGGSASWSDSSEGEGSARGVRGKAEEKGSPAARACNRAFSKLLHKKSKPDARFAKPWEEPMLASHEQVKLQRKLEKEAKLEAKREAEEAKREAQLRKRELLKLANPVPESAMRNQKEQYNMRKGIHKLFQLSSGSQREGNAGAREAKLMMPKASMFETCVSPSATDVALTHSRSRPRPSSRGDIHFATVESNQRDVEAWTMEEYMSKNARLPEWTPREKDEEFGGIEGNQLLNRYFDDDVTGNNLDSDSD